MKVYKIVFLGVISTAFPFKRLINGAVQDTRTGRFVSRDVYQPFYDDFSLRVILGKAGKESSINRSVETIMLNREIDRDEAVALLSAHIADNKRLIEQGLSSKPLEGSP